MDERRKVRPGSGMPYGVGYFEDVDAEEVMDIVEGKIDPADVVGQDEANDAVTRAGRIAMGNAAGHAEDLAERLGKIEGFLTENAEKKDLLKTLAKSGEAKKLKSAIGKLETAMSMYGHDILPKIK